MVECNKVKEQLIEVLGLEDIDVSEIGNDAALFGEGLGLDSVDAIELVIFLDNTYGIKIDNVGESKEVFTSIQTLTDFINKNRKA